MVVDWSQKVRYSIVLHQFPDRVMFNCTVVEVIIVIQVFRWVHQLFSYSSLWSVYIYEYPIEKSKWMIYIKSSFLSLVNCSRSFWKKKKKKRINIAWINDLLLEFRCLSSRSLHDNLHLDERVDGAFEVLLHEHFVHYISIWKKNFDEDQRRRINRLE